MIERKPVAAFLALLMLLSTVFGTLPAAYAQTGEQTTEEAYRTELQITDSPKESYTKGDEIHLQLAVEKSSGGAFGMRLFDTIVTFDTTQFTLIDVSADTPVENNLSIQHDYKPAGSKQSIKLIYSNLAAQSTDYTDRVVLANLTLQVNQSAVTGQSVVEQVLGGMSDAEGYRVTNLTAEDITIAVDDGLQGHQFSLEIAEGESADYRAGDQITVRSFLSMPAEGSVSGASVTICYDVNVFEAAEGTPEDGVTTVLKPGEITLLYLAPAGAADTTKLPLGTFRLTVKDSADSGDTVLTQKDAVINTAGTIKDVASDDSLQFSIAKTGGCTFELILRESKVFYHPGDKILLDVVVSADEAFEPRMIVEEVSFQKNILSFVSAAAVSDNTVVSGKDGMARWVYSDIRGEGAVAPATRITIGSLSLKVADTVQTGMTYVNHNDSNLVIKKGEGVVSYNDITAAGLSLGIARISDPHWLGLEADPAMGRIAVGTAASYEPGDPITLKAEANKGYQFEEWQSSNGGAFTSSGAIETTFIMSAEATTVSAIFSARTEPTVSPATASYDKYTAVDGLSFTIDDGDYSFQGLSVSGSSLRAGTDYTTDKNGLVTVTRKWLNRQETGSCKLVFEFGDTTMEVGLTIIDTTPHTYYRLTAMANYASMGTVTGSGSYEEGDTVNLTAAARPGYRFVGWQSPEYQEAIGSANAADTTFRMPAADAVVTAVFISDSKRIYQAKLTAEGTTKSTFRQGEQLKLKAQINAANEAGYRIRLLEETVAVDTSRFEITSLSPVEGAYMTTEAGVTANSQIVRIVYSSQASAEMTGDLDLGIIGLMVKENAHLGSVALSAVVTGLSDGDQLNPAQNVQAKPLQIEVRPKLYPLEVTVNDTAMGRILEGAAGQYEGGTQIRLKAESLEGFKFSGWQSSAGVFSSPGALETSFVMPTAAVTVTAVFAPMSEPTVSPITVHYDKHTAVAGLTFTLSPGDHSFDGISIAGQPLEEGTDYTVEEKNKITLVKSWLDWKATGSYTLLFHFGEKTKEVALTVENSMPPTPDKTYRLTAVPNFASMGTVTGAGEYKAGDTVQLTAQAKEGYRFVRWEAPAGAEIDKSTETAISFIMPDRDAQITAIFVSVNERNYEVMLAVENQQTAYRSGDQISVTVRVGARDGLPYGIRMLETNVKVDTSIFQITSAAGIGGAIVTTATMEGSHETGVRIYYYNSTAEENATAAAGLAQMILTVKGDATPGSITLTQTIKGFVDAKGDDLTANVTGAGKTLVIEETPKGVTVSGLVRGYDPKVATTLRLMQGDETLYSTEIAAADTGSGQADMEFTFQEVGEGVYTLVVQKPGHTTYTVHNIQVGTSDLNLTEDSRPGAALITLVAGDIDGDASVGVGDVNLILDAANYGKMTTDEGVNAVADLDGDGSVGVGDINVILDAANNGKGDMVVQ